MECRSRCGACCIAPSINLPLPGMPDGKAAGEHCVNLDQRSLRCRIWGSAEYPELCRDFKPTVEVCGRTREEAIARIRWLEAETKPPG